MSRSDDLNDFTTPIVSGLPEAPEDAGRLSPERAADLDGRLRGLAVAHAEAEVGARSYVVSGAEPVDDDDPIGRFLEEGLGHLTFRFWRCPVEGHSDRKGPDGWPVETVRWEGDVAHCTYEGCGRTSADERSDT